MSLPLNRRRRLGRQVVADAVDVFHFMENAVGDLCQYWPIQLLDGGRHGVHRIHGAEDHGVFKAAGVVLHADGFEIRHNGEILPDLFVQSGLLEFLPQDGVCLLYTSDAADD